MRLLVSGGRDFADAALVARSLDAVHRKHGVSVLIHGCARGADTLADEWAKARGVECARFPADWNKDGRAAGPLRNQRMLDEGKPEALVAFPGGRGTAHMTSIAKQAGLPVWTPKPSS